MIEALENTREEFLRWASGFHSDIVRLCEDAHPVNAEEWPDFRIHYRASCETTSLNHASVFIELGEDIREGLAVSVFIERRQRIADRLGIHNLSFGPRGWPSEIYAGGVEVMKLKSEALFILLDSIANGQIAILAKVWPIFGLGKTVAVATQDVQSALEAQGIRTSWWLQQLEGDGSYSKVVKFSGWPRT